MNITRISGGQNYLAAGGKLPFNFDFAPSKYRIAAAFVEFDGTIDVPAAGVTAEQLTQLVSAIECERRLRTTGLGESAMDWVVNMKDVVRPLALAVGAGQALKMYWPITFRDPRNVSPEDTAPATDFYKGKTLDVYCAKPSDLVAGLAVVGTVQLVLHLEELPTDVVPVSIVKGFVEVIGKETRLPPGHYVDLVLLKNDGSNITDAEMGNMQLTLDGKTNVLEKARLPQLLRSFNYFAAKGTAAQAAGIGGEALPNDGTTPLLPLIHQRPGFKATKLAWAEEYTQFVYDGTLAPNIARIYYRFIEASDEAATFKAAEKLGIKVTEKTIAVGKTDSKNALPAGAFFKRTAGLMARRIGLRA